MKSKSIRVPLEPEELARLRAVAKNLRIPLTVWLRALALREADAIDRAAAATRGA